MSVKYRKPRGFRQKKSSAMKRESFHYFDCSGKLVANVRPLYVSFNCSRVCTRVRKCESKIGTIVIFVIKDIFISISA